MAGQIRQKRAWPLIFTYRGNVFGHRYIASVSAVSRVPAIHKEVVEEKLHHYWVRYNGKTYRSLPLGRRGARRPMVQAFHVRKMATHLAIGRNCAERLTRTGRAIHVVCTTDRPILITISVYEPKLPKRTTQTQRRHSR